MEKEFDFIAHRAESPYQEKELDEKLKEGNEVGAGQDEDGGEHEEDEHGGREEHEKDKEGDDEEQASS